ncbi:MAG: hypothetical protein OHK0039_30230 [Bacteroidia bacterium]
MGLLFLLGTGIRTQAQPVLLRYYNLVADGADILLEWEVQNESSISEYRLFRRFNDEPTLTHVATLAANGSPKYSYFDDDIFKTTGRVIHYELHIVTTSQVYTYSRSLSHNPTSVQRTWGSIKSMFRY